MELAVAGALIAMWLAWGAWDALACRRKILAALRGGPVARRALARAVGHRGSFYVVLAALEDSGKVARLGDWNGDGDVWFALPDAPRA